MVSWVWSLGRVFSSNLGSVLKPMDHRRERWDTVHGSWAYSWDGLEHVETPNQERCKPPTTIRIMLYGAEPLPNPLSPGDLISWLEQEIWFLLLTCENGRQLFTHFPDMTKWLVAVNFAYFHDISMTSTAVLSNCGWIQHSALGVSAEDPRWVVEDLDQRGDKSEISPTNLGRCSCLKNHIWDDPNDPRVF